MSDRGWALTLIPACTIQCPGSKVKSSDWLSAVARVSFFGFKKIRGDSVVTVHGDGGCGITNIDNRAHMASPLVKAVAFVRDSHNRD